MGFSPLILNFAVGVIPATSLGKGTVSLGQTILDRRQKLIPETPMHNWILGQIGKTETSSSSYQFPVVT